MAAIDDLRTSVGALIGRVPTDAELARLADSFKEEWTATTINGRAQGALIGIRKLLRKHVRDYAEEQVYAVVIRKPHSADDQQSLLLAAQAEAIAAGDAAERDL